MLDEVQEMFSLPTKFNLDIIRYYKYYQEHLIGAVQVNTLCCSTLQTTRVYTFFTLIALQCQWYASVLKGLYFRGKTSPRLFC